MNMRRREFLGAIGGAAAWPVLARAQQGGKPVIGYLSALSATDRPILLDAFRRGLAVAGYTEDRNVTIEYRFANNRADQLPALATDLVARHVNVIVSTAGNRTTLVAKSATSTIPIVFTTGFDPVKGEFVKSLSRPEANVTGVSWFAAELGLKHIELLRDLVPRAGLVAVLRNPDSPEGIIYEQTTREAARAFTLSLLVLDSRTPEEIDEAFLKIKQQRADGVVIAGDPFLTARASQIAALAAQQAIPVIYSNREFPEAGGLLSYGNNIADAYRRAGVYAGRILHGDKPADLPIERATKFELVFNVKTAKALGIEVPLSLQMRIDEIIE